MDISVIIPTYNEEHNILELIRSLENQSNREEFQIELLIVDGGSSDATCDLVAQYIQGNSNSSPKETAIQLLHSKPGRGAQLNTGAAQASGNILWFVHADSHLSPNSIQAIVQALDSGKKYGCFRLYFFDNTHWGLRLIALGSTLRAKHTMMFGDQGMFVTKQFFHTVGDFPEIPILEDGTWSLLARKHARPIVLREGIGTSARRFTKLGIFRTYLLMQKIKILFYMGRSPEYLVKVYKNAQK